MEVMSAAEQYKLRVVGSPCTYHIGSDRYAGKIVKVSGTKQKIQIVLDGRSEILAFTQRDDGVLRLMGKKHGTLTIGVAETYLAPEF